MGWFFEMDPKGFTRIVKQSAVLRLPAQSAWTTHYSEIQWIPSHHVRALAGSNPHDLNTKTIPNGMVF